MDCPDTHKDVIAQLCGLHYYPGVGCSCASAATCNHHFQRWLKGEPEVKKLHQEYLAQKRGTTMIDQDKPMIFMDAKCPSCGSTCGNGGSDDIFHCCQCGWSGQIGIHPDDIKAIEGFMRRHKERNKEATP